MTLHHAVVPGTWGRLHVVTVELPPEDARDHTANALQILTGLRTMSPELDRAERRARTALAILTVPGGRPLASRHLFRAIDALREVDLDWQIVPEIRGAAALLFKALFALETI